MARMSRAGLRTKATRSLAACGVAFLIAALYGPVTSADTPEDALARAADTTETQAAAQYVSNMRRTLEARVLPALQEGIMKVATSKPPSIAIEVTDDPSPYHIGARAKSDGSLTVRLSIGYLTMHDAALDAVAMSTIVQRPQDLRRYLMYQLRLATQNDLRRKRNERAERALTFADFQGVDQKNARAIYARPEWHALRDGVEPESLGWVVAQLLAQADAGLSGLASMPAARDGAGAARLAAASGWFPVPPLATALGVAAIERSATAPFDERALLCRAASLMDAGVSTVPVSASQRPSQRDARVLSRMDDVRRQIASMRRDGRCDPGATLAAAYGAPANRLRTRDLAEHESAKDYSRCLAIRHSLPNCS